jgi:hypothetical protein
VFHRVLARFLPAIVTIVPFVACGGATSPSLPEGGPAGRCALPADSGSCLAYAPAYYHDVRTGLCTPFVYGGCGGNDNRFASQDDCEAACSGGAPDFGSCSAPSDCTLAAPVCCAACDPVDLTAFVALNRRHMADHARAIGCEGVACAPCQEAPEEQKTSAYFTATCQNSRCVVLDVRTTPVTQCESPADCHLRVGARCCEGCSPAGIVAIASEDELRGLVCDPTPVGCPPCVPEIPPELTPACRDGRCRVTRIP